MAETKVETRIYSEEEYLALDADLDHKYEFFDGRVVARTGARDTHVIIAAQAVTALNDSLRNTNYIAGSSDMRVELEGAQYYVFPDVVVWGDNARWADKAPDTLLTPLLTMEVLSASTAYRDSTIKLEIYKQLPGLLDYLIISQKRVYIEHYRRGEVEGQWQNSSCYRRDQVIRLGFLGLEIPVHEIYRKVDVPEQVIMFEDAD
jgi:Uma2 family endonuclease